MMNSDRQSNLIIKQLLRNQILINKMSNFFNKICNKKEMKLLILKKNFQKQLDKYKIISKYKMIKPEKLDV